MPTYDYHCEKCDETFEVRQSMKDPHLTVCPQESCRMAKWGRGSVKRAMGSGAGLIFKGSGFYSTDYRSEGYKKAAHKAQKESAGTTAPAASGGDSATANPKPATPPAAPPPKPAATTSAE